MSLIRENLMTRPGYSPYCGRNECGLRWPRTHFMHGQFHCICGWRSNFDADFIAKYRARWATESAQPTTAISSNHQITAKE